MCVCVSPISNERNSKSFSFGACLLSLQFFHHPTGFSSFCVCVSHSFTSHNVTIVDSYDTIAIVSPYIPSLAIEKFMINATNVLLTNTKNLSNEFIRVICACFFFECVCVCQVAAELLCLVISHFVFLLILFFLFFSGSAVLLPVCQHFSKLTSNINIISYFPFS